MIFMSINERKFLGLNIVIKDNTVSHDTISAFMDGEEVGSFKTQNNNSRNIEAFVEVEDFVYEQDNNYKDYTATQLVNDPQQFFQGFYRDEKTNLPCKILGSFDVSSRDLSATAIKLQEYTPGNEYSIMVEANLYGGVADKGYYAYNDFFRKSDFIGSANVKVKEINDIQQKEEVDKFLRGCSKDVNDVDMNVYQNIFYTDQTSNIARFKYESYMLPHKFSLVPEEKEINEPGIER